MLNKYIKYFFIIAFCTLQVQILAQEKMLSGVIVVDFRDDYPEGILITNKSTKMYSTSGLAGSFRIDAKVGDTLLFQGSYLIDREFVVRKSTFNLKPFVIHMNYEVITLSDVIVRPPLTGDLSKDINTVKIRDDVEKVYANLGIDIRTLDMVPQERQETILPRLGGIPIPTSLNVEALYKSLTGYYRRMENLNQFEKLDKRIVDVKQYLGSDFFVNTLQIPEADIRGFLLYSYDHSDGRYESYYLQSDFLSLAALFRETSINFKRRLQIRDAE